MKYSVKIDRKREEEVLIFAHERTELVDEIEKLILAEAVELIGYKEREAFKISPVDVCCFTVEDNKIFALTQTEKLQIKQRLYQLESTLDESFVKINKSCIANIRKIERFDASFSGTLSVTFKNGCKDYVSRRNLKTVKERLGVKI